MLATSYGSLIKKFILLSILVLIRFSLFAQTQPLSYLEVVKVSSVTKEQLFNTIKHFIYETYEDGSKVILSEDKAIGEIMGKASIKYVSNVRRGSALTSGYIDYKIRLLIKEGRYQYELYSFQHRGISADPINLGLITSDNKCPYKFNDGFEAYDAVWVDVKKCIENYVAELIKSIKEGVPQQIKKQKEKW